MATEIRAKPVREAHIEGGPPCESDDLWRLLLKVAHSHAERRGLTREEAEDCAMEFVERMLRADGQTLRSEMEGHCFAAWLNRCARNFVANFCRAKARLARHEHPWPELIQEDGSTIMSDCTDPAPAPENGLLQQEFWERMTAAIRRLPPIMQELLVRHHLHGVCIQELAATTARTPHAVEQTLFRARRRLRTLLEGMGLTEPELRAYIIASLPVQTACLRRTISSDR